MKILYTAKELEEIKETETKLYNILHPDLSASWTCKLCGWQIKYEEPVSGLQCVCCGGCGMTCLRPTKETDAPNR